MQILQERFLQKLGNENKTQFVLLNNVELIKKGRKYSFLFTGLQGDFYKTTL